MNISIRVAGFLSASLSEDLPTGCCCPCHKHSAVARSCVSYQNTKPWRTPWRQIFPFRSAWVFYPGFLFSESLTSVKQAGH
ncbi:hypothetical protein L209DRAFT_532658 [Thermothelomyces heterothallicus CBS 203.75]